MRTGWKSVTTANDESVKNMWGLIKTKMLSLRNSFVRKKVFDSSPRWKEVGGFPVDQEARAAIKEKHKLHRKWMTSKRNTCDAEAARVCFRRASNKAKGRIRQCKQRDEAQVAEESKTNPKPFWAHVRGKLKTIEGVAPLSPNPKYKTP